MIPTPEGAKTKPLPRKVRFYQNASVQASSHGFQILLDGKLLRTASRGELLLPTRKLADAIAAEWNAQGKEIIPETMKQMQFACAAIDYVSAFRADVEAETLGFAETDALCYHASEPDELAAMQRTEWQPCLRWVEQFYGASPVIAGGIMPVAQDAALIHALQNEIAQLPFFGLTTLWLMTKITGSLFLAEAVLHAQIPAEEAFRLSRLEETFQNASWGEDEEARQTREAARHEMQELARFLAHISA